MMTRKPFCLSHTQSMFKYCDLLSNGSRNITIENYVIPTKCPCLRFYMCNSVCIFALYCHNLVIFKVTENLILLENVCVDFSLHNMEVHYQIRSSRQCCSLLM